MANTVIALKKSSTPTSVPADLANGELAINYADGLLYYKNVTGQIVSFSSGGYNFSTINANNTLIVADVVGDVLTIEAGDNIQIVGDAINDKITISATSGGSMDYPYANSIGAASNGWANTVVAGANAWTNTVFGYSNTYTNTVGAASNGWTNTAVAGANAWANTVVAGANAWANTVAAGVNAWSNTKLSNTNITLAGSLTANGNVIVYGNNYVGYANSTLAVKFYTYYNVTANSIDTVFNG